MYSTCLFCRNNLGSNEGIEHFPVGRRLAFDSANGRLWVVCRSCERWNLTPIEERWEAIEECEREFERTRLRFSTDHIGLARLRSGLELVRIGQPKRPEFASWRYGDQFGRRRRKHIAIVSGAAVAAGGLLIGQYGFGLALGGTAALNIINGVSLFYRQGKAATTVLASGEALRVTHAEVDSTQLIWSPQRSYWSILLPRKKIWTFSTEPRRILMSDEALDFLKQSAREGEAVVEIQGQEAISALGKILATVNSGGGAPKVVQSAVDEIESAGDVNSFLDQTGRMFAANRRLLGMSLPKDGGSLRGIPVEIRLAMEMAANEENERRALEGELVLLEDEWRAAEEIAAISDALLVPTNVQQDLKDLKNQ